MSDPTIAIIIPCLDEAGTIASVVHDFRDVLPAARIIVYDNGSDDETADEASAAGAIVRKEPHRGKAIVVRRALREVDADVIILVDGDDTYPAESAPALVRAVMDGADMAVGDRSGTYARENHRPLHGLGNTIVNTAVGATFHTTVRDVMSGYRALSRSFARTVTLSRDGFEMETEMTMQALDAGLTIVEIPIEYRDRPRGSASKLHTIRDGTRVLGTITRLVYEHRPLPVFCGSGVVIGLTGLILTISVMIDWWRTGLVLRFPTLIGSVMMMTTGVILVATGLILQTIEDRSRESSTATRAILATNGS